MATIRKTFTFDSEQDAALLAWLEGCANMSETARTALWAAYQAQREALEPCAPAATLGDVVKAIEGLGAVLAGLQVMTAVATVSDSKVKEDPELAAALDNLGI